MEITTVNWLPEPKSLELMRPLTPEPLEYNDLSRSDFSFDQLNPGEKAGKLLDHLDSLSRNVQDTEADDWFVEEKLANFSMFDSIPSQNSNVCLDAIKDSDITGDYELVDLLQANECKLMSVPQADSKDVALKVPEVDLLQPDILSPPETPKMVELYHDEEFSDAEPKTIEKQFRFKQNLTFKSGVTPPESESDFEANSSYVPSEVDSEDSEYEPPLKVTVKRTKTQPTKSCKRKGLKKEEERKLRKKEQNKDAATRYRLRKKMEMEKWRNEEKYQVTRSKQLKDRCEDLEREIRYLKSLMRDMFRKKG